MCLMRNTMGGNEAAGSRRFLIASFKWHNGAKVLSFPDGTFSLFCFCFFFFHVLLLKQCMLQRDSPYQCFQSIHATRTRQLAPLVQGPLRDVALSPSIILEKACNGRSSFMTYLVLGACCIFAIRLNGDEA